MVSSAAIASTRSLIVSGGAAGPSFSINREPATLTIVDSCGLSWKSEEIR
jgi:hypothetical protein